jgi:hypothetical protein
MTRPCDYPKQADGKRFQVRRLGSEYQVYGHGLEHVAICVTAELAEMVADSLELAAEIQGEFTR